MRNWLSFPIFPLRAPTNSERELEATDFRKGSGKYHGFQGWVGNAVVGRMLYLLALAMIYRKAKTATSTNYCTQDGRSKRDCQHCLLAIAMNPYHVGGMIPASSSMQQTQLAYRRVSF